MWVGVQNEFRGLQNGLLFGRFAIQSCHGSLVSAEVRLSALRTSTTESDERHGLMLELYPFRFVPILILPLKKSEPKVLLGAMERLAFESERKKLTESRHVQDPL